MSNEDESKRSSDVLAGVADGALKETINTATDPIAESLRDVFLDKFGDDNQMVELLADSGSKFLVLLVFAEALGMIGEQLGGVIGDADEKSALLARYIRKLAGQELGEKGVKALVQSLPAVKGMIANFDNIKTEDIKYALGEKSEVYKNVLPEVVTESEAELPEEKTIFEAMRLKEE
jgi:hypothetical protein